MSLVHIRYYQGNTSPSLFRALDCNRFVLAVMSMRTKKFGMLVIQKGAERTQSKNKTKHTQSKEKS